MLTLTSRMRWCGTRSAYTNMLNLSRPPSSCARPTSSISLSLLSSFASISSLIGLVIIIFVPIKAVYVLSISYSILLYFGSSWSPSVFNFLFGTIRFCHSSTLTYAYTPTPALLFVLPRSVPSPPANPVCLRHFFLDAVSHHMFHLFLALGFDEMERACVW
ncbi:hypothetical protein EV702DRAFT_222419 [Suillus placidus]|uniref:Uncharacterized protein n=1 Tax=Suillus placidus TaxID=48579 RepID=A0A9P6ZW48_9AGAM|nr:hypothetical protein EV702DRAFT_222419 [Suillus placidus]